MKNGLKWLFAVFGQSKSVEATKAWNIVFDMEDEKARLVLKDLSRYCNFTISSFVANDPHQTAFNEGARDVFLHILEMSNLDLSTVLHFLERENLK